MKKLNLLKLLSCAMTLFIATAFTSCVDDNDDNGLPYLEVSPEVLAFTPDGVPEDGAVITVKTNRPWTLSIAENDQWVVVDPTEGKGTTKVEVSVPASNEGRAATLNFQLKNAYGAYITKTVRIEQGDAPKAGAVGALVEYIKANLGSVGSGQTVDLNYTEATIEAVILANNEYGNNFGKLYVGDNVNLPNTGMIIYSTSEFTKDNSAKYPVGSKVTLDLSNAKYAPYQNLRELKDVTVTVQEGDPVTVVCPTLTAAQFNGGEYQGQYVKVTNVTPTSAFVGQAWAVDKKRAVSMQSTDATDVQSYMATATDAPDFAAMTIADKTGAIYGAAEQIGSTIQIIPTKPEDVAEISVGGDQPAVTTGDATAVTTEGATLAGSSRNIDAATEVGIEYLAYAAEPDWTGATKVKAATPSASWTVDITGLTAETRYSFRAYAIAGGQTYTGAAKDFTTKGTSSADIMVDFADASSYPSGFPTTKGVNELKTYKFAGYDFAFAGSGGADEGYRKSGYDNKDFLLYGKKGAYIGLPAIEGKSLSKVVATSREGASKAVMVGIFDAADQPVAGGEAIKWDYEATGSYAFTYNLTNTAQNTSYKLYINSTHNANLVKLELWYTEGGAVEQPSLVPATASLTFTSAADSEGKTVKFTPSHADGLTLFATSDDPTNFPATVEADNTVRVKATENTGAARTSKVTVYLAESVNAEKKATATINVSQEAPAPTEVTTIADVIKGGANKEVLVQGVIVGTHSSGLVLKDDTGMLYAYLGTGKVTAKVGDTVKLEGKTQLYGNLIQLGTDATLTLVSEGSYTQPAPEVFSGAQIDAYAEGTAPLPIKYVQYTGKLSISGNYYNVTVTGASVKGSISYVPAGLVDANLNGKTVTVTGYTIGTPQTNRNFMNTMALSVVEAGGETPATPTITEVTPSSLSWEAAETGAKTVTVSGTDLNGLTVSTLTAFTASVSGTTVTLTPKAANTGASDIVETLTVTATGGNSKTVTLTHKAPNQGGVTEESLYATGFENNDKTSDVNDYGATTKDYTIDGKVWKFNYADVATTGKPLNGSWHAIARVAKKTTNSPVVESENLLGSESAVTKVTFKAKGNADHVLTVEYSLNGSDWVATDFKDKNLTTTATDYTANVNAASSDKFMLRFTITVPSTTASNRDANLDDITVYGSK